MAENTEISWTSHTANTHWGCTEVHAGCDNCYARMLAIRWGFDVWGNDKPRRAISSVWKDLDRFQRNAAKDGVKRTVFVGSMMDIFEKPMPLVETSGEPVMWHKMDGTSGQENTQRLRDKLFDRIHNGEYPNLIFLLLTKRPSNINKYIPAAWRENGAPENIWFGCSPIDQETADKLIPQLLAVKGKRFLSMEPLLGPVDLKKYYFKNSSGKYPFPYLPEENRTTWLHLIDWIIVGGESGPKARPMHPQWARDIRDQCADAGVPFHFKQWGEFISVSESEGPGAHHQFPDGSTVRRLGKKAAGRLLGGKEHNDTPITMLHASQD